MALLPMSLPAMITGVVMGSASGNFIFLDSLRVEDGKEI